MVLILFKIFLKIHQWIQLVIDFLVVVGRLVIIDSIFSFRLYSFLVYIFIVASHDPLYFCGISCNTCLSFIILFNCVLFLLLTWLVHPKILYFVYLFKEATRSFVLFSYFLFISALIFVISLLLTLSLSFSFSS